MSEVQASIDEKGPGYSEALASWRVHYVDPSGYECALYLEGGSGSEVLRKGEAALARLVEKKCHPISSLPTKGKDTAAGEQTQITMVPSPAGQPKKQCPIHGIEMTLWQKGERRWFSHRWEGRWCKGGAG